MTPTDVYRLLIANGFTTAQAVIGTSVVLAESGGNPNADNGDARGLWQISRRWHPDVPDSVAFSPQASTQWALNTVNNGQGWAAWDAYKQGTYTRYTSEAVQAFQDVGPGAPVGVVAGAESVIGDVANPVVAAVKTALSDIFGPVGKALLNVLFLAGGFVLVAGGLALAAYLAQDKFAGTVRQQIQQGKKVAGVLSTARMLRAVKK